MSDHQSDNNMTDDQKEDILFNQLKELTFDDNLSEEETVDLIISNLQEKNKDLIAKIVKVIGVKKAMLIYNQTLQIEESGGLKREDGKGKKTPGGVFFYVIYHNHDLFDENLKRVFSEESHKKEKQRRLQVKEERRRKTELLKAKFIEEGLLSVENKGRETETQNKNPNEGNEIKKKNTYEYLRCTVEIISGFPALAPVLKAPKKWPTTKEVENTVYLKNYSKKSSWRKFVKESNRPSGLPYRVARG